MSYSCASNRIVSLRRFRFSLQHPVLGLALGALLACFASPASVAAADVGYPLYSTSITGSVTGEKPQSKLWFHAGTWWAILDGPDGVAIYEKSGSNWRRGMFVDAILASSGEADVKWDGSRLHVLLYANAPKYYEFTYDSSLRVWNLVVGFPVSVPKPSGIETMTMETDSAGRAWATAEGNGNVNVYYTTSADRRTWSSSPIILRSGIGADDITSIIAFGGNKIGVFWSDQNRDEFGFCIHRDSDPPDHWQPMEVASSGAGHADDHLNLAYDSLGRVYAITKDDFDRMTMHRRELDGHWTVKSDVTGASGTRGIVMISEADNEAYILWTDWTTSPDRIVYRKASLGDLRFGSTSTFMSIGASLNNVSGTKQILPAGCLLAVAEGQSKVWWNGWGVPTPVTLPPPTAPKALSAALLEAPARVELDWSRPSSGVPQGYYVYRQLNGGTFARLNSSPMSATNYIDSNPVAGTLGYMVTAFANNQEGPGSAIASVIYAPPPPPSPDPPRSLTATQDEITPAGGAAAYLFDETSGQTAADVSGNAHTGQLGTQPVADSSDPLWTAGQFGNALRFDGSNDHVRIPDAPDLRFASSFTLEAWIQRTTLGREHVVLAKGDSGRRNFWMQFTTANCIELGYQTSGAKDHRTTSAFTLADAAWHHVAGVYDQAAGELRIYVDGSLVHHAPDSGTPLTNADPLLIGAKTSAGSIKSVFQGCIDQPRLAPGALYTGDFTPPVNLGGGDPYSVIRLDWLAPQSGTPAGYRVYRQAEDGSFSLASSGLVAAITWMEPLPASGAGCYRVTAVDGLGHESAPSDLACAGSPVAKAAPQAAAHVAPPSGLQLHIGPNPFNPTTTIRFRLESAGHVRCAVYDVRGARVAVIADDTRSPGEHSLVWNAGSQLASGEYFMVLQVGSQTERRKLLLLK